MDVSVIFNQQISFLIQVMQVLCNFSHMFFVKVLDIVLFMIKYYGSTIHIHRTGRNETDVVL